jgi:hypothetical protein
MDSLILSIVLLFSFSIISNAQVKEELYITESGDYFYVNDGYAEYRLGRTIGGGEIIKKRRTLYAENDPFYTGGTRSYYRKRDKVNFNDTCNFLCLNLYNQHNIKLDSLKIAANLFYFRCHNDIVHSLGGFYLNYSKFGKLCTCIECLPKDSIFFINIWDMDYFHDGLLIEHKHYKSTEYDVFLFSENDDTPSSVVNLNSCWHKLELKKTDEGKLHAVKFLNRCTYKFIFRVKRSLDVDIILKPVPKENIEEVKQSLPLRANLK